MALAKQYKKIVILCILLIIVIFSFFFWRTTDNVIVEKKRVQLYDDYVVEEEKDRLDVLLLGIRGNGDPAGGLLADTIMLMSFNKNTKKTTLISIPRDLYVEMPDGKMEKINSAYAFGWMQDKEQGGINYMREVVQFVTGVYVDYTVVVNFDAFIQTIDLLEGVDIYRNTPFSEPLQWQKDGLPEASYWRTYEKDPPADALDQNPITLWEFYIPKGSHTLGGRDALYYIRSRFSSSDFERSRRQHEVIAALKNKVVQLNVATNPALILELREIVDKYVRTDMSLLEMERIISLAQDNLTISPHQEVLEPTADGMLISTQTEDGRYVITPRTDDWNEVRNFFQRILYDIQ